ncbi:MAG: HAMP domain-containing histidine kinase [Chitinophagaceae bacterium]|nr:HAMP domain-containing histidine kinase [Oligoflexus sp.]
MRKAHSLYHKLIEPFQPSFAEGYSTEAEKSNLLIRIRWILIAMQLLVIAPALMFEYLLRPNLWPYLGVVASLLVFNLAAKRFLQTHPLSLSIQLSVDLIALCTLLILTAGCHNPFSSLLFISAILGPMFLARPWAVAYLVEAAIGLVIVCYYTEPLLLNAHGEVVSSGVTITAKIIVLFSLGCLTLWLKACLDRSQSRYETLYKQRQRLNSFRAVGIVSAQLSHELSTPLNTLKIMMDRMKRDERLKASHDLLIAEAALAQCESTIRDLFDCSVDAGSLSFKETNLGNFIRSVCDNWALDFPGVQLAFGIDPKADGLNYQIPATPFAQAVLDILDNAKEASETDHVAITVDIEVQTDAILISFSDRGRGLDKSILNRIGEPFVSTKSTGTGLGVYNASTLLEALGGSLGLADRMGGGTQVSMVLPR